MIFALLVLTTSVSASSGNFNYLSKGKDWTGTCATGQRQSPVDVKKADVTTVKYDNSSYLEITLEYVETSTMAELLANTYELRDSFGDISVNGTVYSVLQFHYHSPSEHTFEGKHKDLEMHIVHASELGQLFVIAIFFDLNSTNDENKFIEDVIEAYDNEIDIDLSSLFKRMTLDDFVFYEGSLTTPNCTEIASFALWKKVQPISQQQLNFFTSFWADNNDFAGGNGNNRVTQPLNGRKLTHYLAKK